MARSRGRSRGPGGTLGTLLRTTLAQAGVVRDVLERGAREGRARIDDVRRERRREQALARLGEVVLEAVRAGRLEELYDVPEAAEALSELDAMEDDQGGQTERGEEPPWVAPRTRERFDRREARDEDDGTVSSSTWRPPRPASGAAAVWRPPREDAAAPAPRPTGREPAREPGARFAEKPTRPAPAPRRGGIQFAADDGDEDDLAQYMHPDDVPPKPDREDD